MDPKPYAVVAIIQNEVLDKLAAMVAAHDAQPGRLAAGAEQNLWDQLHGDALVPKGIDLTFLHEIGGLALPQLFRDDPLDVLRSIFQKQHDVITQLLTAKSSKDALTICRDVFAGQLRGLWNTVGPLIGSQLSVLVSFATTAVRLPDLGGPAIEAAVLKYFFTADGYSTVDGTPIVSPIQLSSLDPAALQLKTLFSQRTAERYVRDIVRLMVDAADDARYDVPRRYEALLQNVGQEKRAKYADWFKGFSAMAEAAVTSSVEEACLGVSEFQTNALIAASAGTFAGTAARKATQHVFLAELEHLIK